MGVSATGAAVLSLVGDIGTALGYPAGEAGVMLATGFSVATSPVCRKVLALLSDRRESTAEGLAREAVDDEDVPFRSADRLALVLHHRHLPKLDDEDYVEYDPDSGTVVHRADPESAESHGG